MYLPELFSFTVGPPRNALIDVNAIVHTKLSHINTRRSFQRVDLFRFRTFILNHRDGDNLGIRHRVAALGGSLQLVLGAAEKDQVHIRHGIVKIRKGLHDKIKRCSDEINGW